MRLLSYFKTIILILILLLGSCQSASLPIFIEIAPKGDTELERWCQYPDTREWVLCKDQQNRGNSQCISDCESTFEKCYAQANDDTFNELFKEHKCKGNKNRCYRQCTLTLGTSLKERKWCQNPDTHEWILCEDLPIGEEEQVKEVVSEIVEEEVDSVMIEEDCDPGMESCP